MTLDDTSAAPTPPFWRTAVAALLLVVTTTLTGWVIEGLIAAFTSGQPAQVKLYVTLVALPVAAIVGYVLARKVADAALRGLYDGQLIFLLTVVGNVIAVATAVFAQNIMLMGRIGAIVACLVGLWTSYRVFYCKPTPPAFNAAKDEPQSSA